MKHDEFVHAQMVMRQRIYRQVLAEFKRSGITPETLAKRLGRSIESVNAMLQSPHSWSLDDVSDMLIAISGAEFEYKIVSMEEGGE